MSGTARTAFESARELFLNPKDPQVSVKRLADDASIIVRGVAGRELIDNGFAGKLAAEYLGGTPAVDRDGKLVQSPGARYFDHLSVAQLHPAGNMPAILAALAANIANNNTIVGQVSPLEAVYEQQSVDWLMRHIAGFDTDKGSGLLVTGGTLANLTALAVARLKLERDNRHFRPTQTLVSKVLSWTGLSPRATKVRQALLFGTSMGHYSLLKSTGILAPGEMIRFERIPLEKGGYRMDAERLRKRIKSAHRRGVPVMGVVAVAGETETGVVDDLDKIASITEKYGIHLHIDGAYGAPFGLSDRAGHLFRGMDRANSVTVDPHKYMYTPYAAAAILFRDATEHALMKTLNRDGGSYMFQDEGSRRAAAEQFTREPYLGTRRIEGSMGGQAAAMVHATIQALGKEGLGALLDHTIDMTRLFVSEMEGFTDLVPAHEVQLNTVCLRPNVDQRQLTPNQRKVFAELVEKVSGLLEERYGIYLSTTDLLCQDPRLRRQGIEEKVFRVVFTHPYTGPEEVKYVANALKTLWEEVING